MSEHKVMGYIGVDPSISHTGIVGVWGEEVEARQIKIKGGVARLDEPIRITKPVRIEAVA